MALDHDDEASARDGELASLVRWWMAAGGRAERTRRDHTFLRLAPAPVEEAADDTDDTFDPIRVGEPPTQSPTIAPDAASLGAVLPHRRTRPQLEQPTRIAVLMQAGSVSDEVAAGLIEHLDGRGSLAVCRAYADDDQALVAMALDAVDIARDSVVDEVVLAGDLTSMLPLVHRLHAAGVRVVAVGDAHTPHDVRAACHEFIDTASLDGAVVVTRGRHRA